MGAYDYKPEGGSGGLYLKFLDGDSFRLRIIGEPVVFDNDYNGNLSTKYAWPVYNHDNETVQILQGGVTIFNMIAGLVKDEDWGDPTQYDIKVSRSGSTKDDTKYTVSPSPKSKDLPKDLEGIDLVEKISASPNAYRVELLSKVVAAGKRTESDENKKTSDDVVIDDVEDGPINLDEIPF
jgi:hypothetical protein